MKQIDEKIRQIDLRVEPRVAATEALLRQEAARTLGVSPERISAMRVVRRSIDARQRRVMVNVGLKVAVGARGRGPAPVIAPEAVDIVYQDVSQAKRTVIVVGAGPAGLFAALRLIELGVKPIVLERGKEVDERKRDMAAITRNQAVDPESNYCFGEGGAGAFSDGKLYTRSRKRGSVERILSIFYHHGASEDILVDAHPHIGTDRLPAVIRAMRETIRRHGGEVHFGRRVDSLIIKGDEVCGVTTADGSQIAGPVILATGHSARDVYRSLDAAGVELEPKGIAVGVRLEHPQELIDRLRYHIGARGRGPAPGRGPYLPPAEYTMLTRVEGRGVYSFCMCPGGFIIPAASGPNQLVVNGMSPSNRGTRWANAGMVVEVLPEDVASDGPLKMMEYQEQIEERFYDDADGTQSAPAQRMTDFVKGRQSGSLPRSSYAPGVHPARVDLLLPVDVSRRLKKGFEEFGKKSPGFLTSDALVVGDETRTSSPVRIPRDGETLQHVRLRGLYPCGEGAGYAGGIVSAAIDGERCADAATTNYTN